MHLHNKKINIEAMIDWLRKATTGQHVATGNYRFHVRCEPEIIDTASTINITTFADKTETSVIPSTFRWFRVRNGLTEEIIKYKGSSYICEPSDVGAIIKVEILSNDLQHYGKANIQFGPIKLSMEIKKQIMSTLSSGSAVIHGSICYNGQEKQCQLKIFEDMIKICHAYSELNYTFDYSIYEPRIQIAAKDTTKAVVTFGQKYEIGVRSFIRDLFQRSPSKDHISHSISSTNSNSSECKMEIRFPTRAIKDIFILTLKSFYTKRQLKNSVIMQKIEHIDFKNSEENFDYLMQIQSLKADVLRLSSSQQKAQNEKMLYRKEVGKLEKEIQQIIMTYTKIVEDKCRNQREFNESYSVLVNKRDEVIGRKYQNLEHENMNLNERIRHLTAEIDEIRFNASLVKNNQTQFAGSNPHPNFLKKSSAGGAMISGMGSRPNENSQLMRMLDDLNESQVIEVPENMFGIKERLDTVSEEKKQLQRKLERSFKAIDDLEHKLREKGSLNSSNIHPNTARNFYSMPQNNDFQNSSLPILNISSAMEKLQKQNKELRRLNQSLAADNRTLQSDMSSLSTSRIIIKPNEFSNNPMGSQSSHQLWDGKSLQQEIDKLRKQNKYLREQLSKEKGKNEKMVKSYNKKIQDLNRQIDMYRKNQDVMNRSQCLSMEMDSYNEEQLRILRQHNQFLVSENQKLTKACEKYMSQAKQNNKLRKQIIELKTKLNAKMLNPQTNSQQNSVIQ